MWVSILSIVAYLVPFLLGAWQASRPETIRKARDAEIQKGRLDVANLNVAPVNAAFDRLLSDGSLPAKRTADAGGIGRQHSDADTTKYLNDVLNS